MAPSGILNALRKGGGSSTSLREGGCLCIHVLPDCCLVLDCPIANYIYTFVHIYICMEHFTKLQDHKTD